MKECKYLLLSFLTILIFTGCGKNITKQEEIILSDGSEKIAEYKSTDKNNTDKEDHNSINTTYIVDELDYLKNYETVDALLDDAYAVVKVKVLSGVSNYVRSYIYTTYEVEIINTIYGNVGNTGEKIKVNMPGGYIQGEQLKKLLEEIYDGKDAGEKAYETNIMISDGGTDELLKAGDETYLFLRLESDEVYAVVGEYKGEFLSKDGIVVYDPSLSDNHIEEGLNGANNIIVDEENFIKTIKSLITD